MVPVTVPAPLNFTAPVDPDPSKVPLLVILPPEAMVKLVVPDKVSVLPVPMVTEAALASEEEMVTAVPAGIVTVVLMVGIPPHQLDAVFH